MVSRKNTEFLAIIWYICALMSSRQKYIFNPHTLAYEIGKEPAWKRVVRRSLFLVGSVLFALHFFWLAVGRFDITLPQTQKEREKNSEWRTKIEAMNRRLDADQTVMNGLSLRSENIYRNVFGMNSLPADVTSWDFGGVNRYAYLGNVSQESPLRKTAVRLDKMTAGLYVESKSLDEISMQAKNAGEMMSCIPAITPINPIPGTYRFTSPYGYRSDPINGRRKLHKGVDFALKQGNPVYATGDGVVEKVRIQIKGYGKELVINHGFGYKTRYAHLSEIVVTEGMKVKRGDLVAKTGNSGKSTAPHLHYEVLYKGQQINPANFYDLNIDVQEYASMVNSHESNDFPERPKVNKIKKR